MLKGVGFWAFKDQVLALVLFAAVTSGIERSPPQEARTMRTIGFIIRKEFQQLFRDKRLLPLDLHLPRAADRAPGVCGEHGREGHPDGGLRPGPERGEPGAGGQLPRSPAASSRARTFRTRRGGSGASRRESRRWPWSSRRATADPSPGRRRRRCSFLRTAPTRSPRLSG